MIIARSLTADEFRDCFAAPMTNVTAEAQPVVDIWPYVDALDLDELQAPSLDDVQYVYRDAKNRFDQVLIGAGRSNLFLAVVVDLNARAIFGHHMLDLDEQFGTRADA
jgi:hypothetical protein